MAPELLLGKIYLDAGKRALARHTFDRLRTRVEIADVLPFWVVSVHLSTDEAGGDADEAIRWAGRVRDPGLRERLLSYLFLRLGRHEEAVRAGRRAVEALPEALASRQLLVAALIARAHQDAEPGARLLAELASCAATTLALDPESRRSQYLARAAWETLRHEENISEDASGPLLRAARDELVAASARLGLSSAPLASRVEFIDDFVTDAEIADGDPLTWRVIAECCPGKLSSGPDGLRVSKLSPDRGYDAWLVTEEVLSGDVTIRVHADIGEGKVSSNLHVDVGTASLYYASVFRDGRCEIGRLSHGEKTSERLGAVSVDGGGVVDFVLELRSVGELIESRVWRENEARPDAPTLRMEDAGIRLGSVGISTSSRPAVFRSVELGFTTSAARPENQVRQESPASRRPPEDAASSDGGQDRNSGSRVTEEP